ncbi:hypothetical protein BDR03DRAFT_952316, partial [Suillus americanus]
TRFPTIVLTVVAALASSISATTDESAQCGVCTRNYQCRGCGRGTCVSFSGLCPGFNDMTDQHGSTTIIALDMVRSNANFKRSS